MPSKIQPSEKAVADTSDKSGSAVDRVYQQVKALAISFALRPGERINEVALAKQLLVSRTPLREALNRLTSDGFLTFSPKYGFYRRPLDVKEILDLYELRQQIEVAGVQFAVTRASPEALDELTAYLNTSNANLPGRTIDDMVALDEGFHERLISLTGNAETLRVLQNVNSRVRFLRWIDMDCRRQGTQAEHFAILDAVKAGDAGEAASLLERHIHRRLDQVVDAVKESYARIYIHPNVPPG
jgi:DNA-binding GntR family transcriptional regulator